jgi:class 3 adenylate cyclase/tetratricopeptide (TPR) repeat protein
VTVLFCDVVGYTELGERLDPESLRMVMSRYFEQAVAVLERHGGTVNRFVGDEVMAVFGVPAVREDDALRAVRAAVELRACMSSVDSGLGSGLEVRIGLNTGEVVASDLGAGRGFGVTGDPVSLGKRIEQSAAAGEIMLGATTFALIAHAVRAAPLEPVRVKGKSREVRMFRFESVAEDAGAIPRRDDAPLIGRERELKLLRDLYVDVLRGGGARLITLIGEPGIGKSRLARTFLAGPDVEATVLIGRCPPYGEGVTFWPLRELLRQAGRDEGVLTGPSHEVFAAVRHVLEQMAREHPLAVVFDDIQWAEPTFLDFVEYLRDRLAAAPVLLICLGRPELAELRPALLQPPAATLPLEPLSDADSELLLESLGTPATARSRITPAAEGNPLYIEQLAAIAEEYTTAGAMPGTIRGVLHERLDRLEVGERAVLERASVTGRSFTLEAVLDVTPPHERGKVRSSLLALTRKHFVRADTNVPDGGFRFHHALIRDAAYDGIPKATRADLHERTAARLADQAADEAVVGYHVEQSFMLRRDLGSVDAELGARAGRLLRAAGEDAFRRTDLPATVSLFERARALLPEEEVAQLLPKLGEALFEAGKFGEADDVLAEVIDRAETDPLLAARARVDRQFVRLHAEPGIRMGEAQRIATEAQRVFAAGGDDVGQCRTLRLLAHIEWVHGHVTRADNAWRRAADHAQAAGDEREFFEILGWRASATVPGPTPVPAGIQTCSDIREEVRLSPVQVAVTLQPLAALHAMQGEFDEARSLIREANAILDDLGRMHSAVSHHEAMVEILAGDYAKAEERLQLGFERLDEIGEKALLATTAALVARVTYAQERYDDAERFCSLSERSGAVDDLSIQVPLLAVRAKLLAREGRRDEAEAHVQKAVRMIARTDMLNRHGDALLDLAEVFRLGGQATDAEAAACKALEFYTRKGNAVSAAAARALIPAPAST